MGPSSTPCWPDRRRFEFKDWEYVPYFDACLPIEAMAEQGRETLRHGPLPLPVGLTNPHKPEEKPSAIVQLRQDNALGTPGGTWWWFSDQAAMHGRRRTPSAPFQDWEKAVSGCASRAQNGNTFINSPRLLDETLRLKLQPRLRLRRPDHRGGRLCRRKRRGGVDGRPHGRRRTAGRTPVNPTAAPTTAMGAMIAHITGGHLGLTGGSFQPMNVNYGLIPPMEGPRKREDGKTTGRMAERGRANSQLRRIRALADIDAWLRAAPACGGGGIERD